MTDDGIAVLQESFEQNGYVDGRRRVNTMQYIFCMILCYWFWLKKTTYWKRDDTQSCEEARHAIQKMLQQLINLWPCNRGHGWFKPKIHEQLHIPRDIVRNGSPRNTYSGPLEQGHIALKDHSKQTQRNRELLDEQLSNCITETQIIETTYKRMMGPLSGITHAVEAEKTYFVGISKTSSKAILKLSRGTNGASGHEMKWVSESMKRHYLDVELFSLALECIKSTYQREVPGFNSTSDPFEINVFKEYQFRRRSCPWQRSWGWHWWRKRC